MQWILCTVFFIFWVFYCFTFFCSVWMAGEFEHHDVSPSARHSDWFYASVLRFAFWHTLPLVLAFTSMNNWKPLHGGNFLTPTATNTRSAWQLGLLLHLLWSDGLGHSLLVGVHTQGPWRGCILFINIRCSPCQLLWAATDLHGLDCRDVRTCATIRPLLGWV